MTHVGKKDKKGCWTLSQGISWRRTRASKEQDCDDDFLFLCLLVCSDITAGKSCSYIGIRNFWKACYFPFSLKSRFLHHGRPPFLVVISKTEGIRKQYCVIISDRLFRVFCSLEQNAWNTFHIFRNRNSVSIERLFGFIPFILIPE